LQKSKFAKRKKFEIFSDIIPKIIIFGIFFVFLQLDLLNNLFKNFIHHG